MFEWLKLNFASCVMHQTRSLGVLILYQVPVFHKIAWTVCDSVGCSSIFFSQAQIVRNVYHQKRKIIWTNVLFMKKEKGAQHKIRNPEYNHSKNNLGKTSYYYSTVVKTAFGYEEKVVKIKFETTTSYLGLEHVWLLT